MEHVDYVFTFGMNEDELADLLGGGDTGVLSLARGDEAYAIPVSYHYDGDRLYLRLEIDEKSKKWDFVETTETVCFVVYETKSPRETWSIVVTGQLAELDEQFDDATINELFAPLHVFDEPVDEAETTVLELRIEEITGRKTRE